jgi:hypothetical protein
MSFGLSEEIYSYLYSRMIRNPLYYILILLFTACSSSSYLVISESQIQKPVNEAKKHILLRQDFLDNPELWAVLLNKGRWEDVRVSMRKIDDPNTMNVIVSIQYLLDKQYAMSYDRLKSVPDATFDYQALILKMDCLKELGVDSVDFLAQYQKAFDLSPSAEVKQIAKDRYRFYKYAP